MRIVTKDFGGQVMITGYLHEMDEELPNIKEYPSILILPGGGFRICSSKEAEPVAMEYFAAGYQAFVLSYTTVTKKPDATFDDPMNDVAQAFGWLAENKQHFLMADGKLALLGFSGGGHLAAAYSTRADIRPDALILIYPGIVSSAHRALNCPDIPEKVDKNTPPTFIVGMRDDQVTPPYHQLAFADALQKADVDYEIHIFKGGMHGISLGNSYTSAGLSAAVDPDFAQWMQMSKNWLKKQFGDFMVYGQSDGAKFSVNTPVGKLLKDEKAKAVLAENFPMALKAGENPQAKGMPLLSLIRYMPGDHDDVIEELDKRLKEI